jgi:hypothetical protein
MKAAAKTLGSMLVLVLAFVGSARGSPITFGLVEEFSGATPPEGTVPPPWLTVTLDDGADDKDGIVTLTLAATNLTGSERVKEWCLNLDPQLTPTDLVFSEVTRTGTLDDPMTETGTDAYQPDGDGLYDIQFTFNHTGGASKNFGAGESVQYTVHLNGSSALSASSFDFLSTPAGGHGPYHTAAHVLSIGPDAKSGWVTTTPEPATVVLLGLGGVGLLLTRRRA